jgi:thiol-disulfide isomerase/thioredoxin
VALRVQKGVDPAQMAFTALNGEKTDLAKLRGKLVLIDFWATWCKPCVAELPHLKAVYEKYRDQGLEVVGISFDLAEAKEELVGFLKKHEVTWPQSFEGKGWGENRYQRIYGIGELPTVFLLDKEGKLVDKNARGERLEPLIRKYLSLEGGTARNRASVASP